MRNVRFVQRTVGIVQSDDIAAIERVHGATRRRAGDHERPVQSRLALCLRDFALLTCARVVRLITDLLQTPSGCVAFEVCFVMHWSVDNCLKVILLAVVERYDTRSFGACTCTSFFFFIVLCVLQHNRPTFLL